MPPSLAAIQSRPRRVSASAPVGGALPSFTLTSTVGGSNLPFAIGHAFKQGDAPTPSAIGANTAIQVNVKNTWPDGSAKFAILSGLKTLTANVPGTVSLANGGTQSSGATLTTTDLKATGITAAIGCGAPGTASWATTDWDTPFETWCSGPAMSWFYYRKQVGSDPHLVAWLSVTLWSNGQVSVVPWVENGYLLVASPTNKSATYTFTLTGSGLFSASIDILNRNRTPLISGTGVTRWWSGTNPDISPKHDRAYLVSTSLVPNYSTITGAGSSAFTPLPTAYTPLMQGMFRAVMGGPSDDLTIAPFPGWDVLYISSGGDKRAWVASQLMAYAGGRYGTHYRDETTNRPISFASYPNLVLDQSQSSGVADTAGSSTGAYTPVATGGTPPTWDLPHHPLIGAFPYLLTGEKYFLEELQFIATTNFLKNSDTNRSTTAGIFKTDVGATTTRGMGWAMRTLAYCAALTPDADTLATQFRNSVDSNCSYYWTKYVNQSNNPLGMVKPYDHYSIDRDVTISIASPGVVTWVNHKVVANQQVNFSTTGALPTGILVYDDNNPTTTRMFAKTILDADTFTVSTTSGGAVVNTTGSQSGVQHVQAQVDDFSPIASNWWASTMFMDEFCTIAWAIVKELKIIGSGQSAHLDAFLTWKFTPAVQRLGSGVPGTYNYRYAGARYTVFSAPRADADYDGGTGPWTADWGALAAANAMNIPVADGGTSLQGDSGGTPSNMANGYWGYLQAACSYAVNNGISGAAAGYARLTGASNYDATLYIDAPQWGIVPR